MSNLSKEIIKQLDDCNKKISFPVLDNGYFYLAGTRMSVFANQIDWAIIVETVGFNPRAWNNEGFEICCYCFGNSLPTDPRIENMEFIFPINDGITAPLFLDHEAEILNPLAQDIKIREQLTSIAFEHEIYTSNGIILENPPSVYAFELLRLLFIKHKDLLIATETELVSLLSKKIPLILQLSEWHHPDIADGEEPSKSETFIMIANTIEKLDTKLYQPSKLPNTHWSNWKYGGTL